MMRTVRITTIHIMGDQFMGITNLGTMRQTTIILAEKEDVTEDKARRLSIR